ncbi:natural resistance-associated macrophage protein [Gloeopeniophorella convolvens]|nr:natural resistance-associated macrophage protein [Gloeopeniophorella convolvens]
MSDSPQLSEQPALRSPEQTRWTRKCCSAVWTYVTKHAGIGIICAVAYFDPGNWGVDLQAGSQYGYKLLFVVLLAGLFAVVLQSLACKLGVVTGLDLASHCRLLLYNRPRHTKLCRWLFLYPLYTLSEIAIVSTDLAELLGSAIALNLLFPKLPLWGGVLLTASDVLLILAFADPLQGRPVRSFELLIGVLVLAVLICMCIIVSKVQVDWGATFDGYLPSNAVFEHGGLYTSVGILGATVMPHSLFLGSALSTQDRASSSKNFLKALSTLFRPVRTDSPVQYTSHADRPNNSLSFVTAHLRHGITDVVVNLLGLAVVINSLILILASAIFHKSGSTQVNADIYDAHAVLVELVGKGAAVIFALALLCAGQSASLVATVAGQTVSEGFLHWRVSPVVRRLLTRLMSLVPSMAVAVTVGRAGIDTMLVASQVVLSIVLPFIVLPLVWLTSSRAVMQVRASVDITDKSGTEEQTTEEFLDFSNGWIVAGLGYAIWALVVVANAYVLITLMLGKGA